MPVPAQVGSADRNHHHVPGSRQYLLLAAGTQVRLVGLVGLDAANLDGVAQRGIRAHSSIPATTAAAMATNT